MLIRQGLARKNPIRTNSFLILMGVKMAKFKFNPEEFNRIRQEFRAKYPKVLSGTYKGSKPLKVGIHRDLIEQNPEIRPTYIGIFLNRHTSTVQYLASFLKNSERFDLDGIPCGEIPESNKKFAYEKLLKMNAAKRSKNEAA